MVWRPGKANLADFLSKAHPIHHFKTMVPYFDAQWLPHPRTVLHCNTICMTMRATGGQPASTPITPAPAARHQQDVQERTPTPPGLHRGHSVDRFGERSHFLTTEEHRRIFESVRLANEKRMALFDRIERRANMRDRSTTTQPSATTPPPAPTADDGADPPTQ